MNIDNLLTNNNYKKHPKFDHIVVSKNGEIFSLKLKIKRIPWLRKDGYHQLSIHNSTYLWHRVVAETWIDNQGKKPKVNHKNGIKTDNRAENLEWMTQRENIIHARDVLGVKYSLSGFDNANAKFMESHRIILMNLHKMGFNLVEISKIMGFSIPTIRSHLSAIINKM